MFKHMAAALAALGPMSLDPPPFRRPVSKRSPPGKGKVRINDNSSLRKLMRAARRGMVSSERARVIVGAMMTSERGKVHHWQRVEAAKRKVDEAQRKMIESAAAVAS